MSPFTFGSDPEFALTLGGQFRSAIGIIPGTKQKPHRDGKNLFYNDNVLAECTVQPAKSKEEAVAHVGETLNTLASIVRPCRVVAQASQNYPEAELRHPDAIAIGCEREFCCYALVAPEPPEEVMRSKPLRSCGGHVHIGTEVAQTELGCIQTIRMMDLLVGVPSVLLDHDPTSKRRRELYGLAGRFRKPEWGAEYRSMGNFWLTSPRLVELIHDLCQVVVDFVGNGGADRLWEIDYARLNDDSSWDDENFTPASCHKCVGYDVAKVRRSISAMDTGSAGEMMNVVKTILPAKVFRSVEKMASRKKEFDLYTEWSL